ncbi:MAG: sugar phosphate isomerase/epimerase [Deltaproteobacteria bacterium]|jgi:sugar phosphate isomerase/epimerase|nr:sugar phosphate isomerase/epimerase [Deltaproteobacteria bacterium]
MPSPQNPVPAYATTYLRSVRLRDAHFRTLTRHGLGAELYFQYGWDKLSLPAHRELARVVAGELGRCAVHLPYSGQGPARELSDPDAVGAFRRSLEAAALYAPDHLVGHAEYQSLRDSASGARKFPGLKNGPLDDGPHRPSREFLDRSAAFWRLALDASGARLFLENTFEHSPLPILRLIGLLGPRAGLCLDIGHWFHYAMGRHWDNLREWVALAGPSLRHLHLHDNDGEGDQHRGLGQAGIDLPMVWGLLREVRPHPSYTLENHRLEGLEQSLAYLEGHPLF